MLELTVVHFVVLVHMLLLLVLALAYNAHLALTLQALEVHPAPPVLPEPTLLNLDRANVIAALLEHSVTANMDLLLALPANQCIIPQTLDKDNAHLAPLDHTPTALEPPPVKFVKIHLNVDANHHFKFV